MYTSALDLFLWLPHPRPRLICPYIEFASCAVYRKVFPECTCTYNHMCMSSIDCGQVSLQYKWYTAKSRNSLVGSDAVCTRRQPVHPAQMFICFYKPKPWAKITVQPEHSYCQADIYMNVRLCELPLSSRYEYIALVRAYKHGTCTAQKKAMHGFHVVHACITTLVA